MRNIIKKILREELQRPIPKMVFESRTKKGLLVEGTNTVPEMDFQKFYEDNWDKMLYGVCMKYTKDINKAEDYCQNGFMKAYQNLNKYESSGSFAGWVRRIINNAIIDEIRSEKMKHYSSEEPDWSRIDSQDEPYEEDYDYSVEDIKLVLPDLSPAYREVFKLYYIHGLKHDQIAKKLGISPSTSKTNLMKAKQKVRELLSK